MSVKLTVIVENVTYDEMAAALRAMPVGRSAVVERKAVDLGGRRYDVTGSDLSPEAARNVAAALHEHMTAVQEGTPAFDAAAALERVHALAEHHRPLGTKIWPEDITRASAGVGMYAPEEPRSAEEESAPGVEGVLRANADLREQLEEARTWARHGYELGQRSCTWSDHGVAPAWLTEGHDPAALAGPDPHAACEASRAELATERDRAVRRAEKAEGWARRRARDRDDARARLDRVRELAESWMSAQVLNRAAIKRGSFAPRTTPGPEDFLKAIDEPQRVFIAFDGSTGGQPVVGTGGPGGAVRFHTAAFPLLSRDQVNAAIASARLRADLAAGRLHHGGTL